jgi:DNA helicase HerA-like ATPase
MATSDNKVADTDEKIFIGKGEQPAWLTLGLANRHGLVTGATGTGKTVSLQVMAEGFARAGVPVFAADIKGDLSGISEVGESKDFILKRAGDMGLAFQPDQFSTVFWDVFGEQGHPVRATVSEMGPLHKVVGGVVADIGKSVGGSLGGSVGRALVRGALGGLLRR